MSKTQPSQPFNPGQRFARFLVFNLVRLFYPRIEIRGRENLPAQGPVMFVLNHPNGLLDALLLMAGLEWPVAFWAKSTLFGNPVGKFFCEAFGALPIYRQQDEGLPGGPRGDANERNEITFARSRQMLQQGGALALFPEGVTHSGSQLLELRTGAARLALSSEAETGWPANLQIVPVGLWYENKTLFRTAVLLVVGEPFDLKAYAAAYAIDEVQTVKDVTQQIEAGLDKVVLQAENAELLAAVPVLAVWTAPQGNPLDLPAQHAWTERLFAAYEYLRQHDPVRLEGISQEAWDYAHTLQRLGIADPWTLELPVPGSWQMMRQVVVLISTFPLALAGFSLSYGPYRLAGPVAVALIGKYDTQISTFKLIGGAIFVLVGWLIETIGVGIWLGWGWSLLLLVSAPPLSYIALWWGEQRRELGALLARNWSRLRQQALTQALTARRQHLAQQVLEAVEVVSVENKILTNGL